jgi:ABC-type polysaccharide/polyol phosphate transport system ATPase subunit
VIAIEPDRTHALPERVRVGTVLIVSATVRDRGAPTASAVQAPQNTAVSLRNLHKTFKLPHEQYHTLKERVLHPFRTSHFDVLNAVDDITLDIGQGEFFGIVGRNGSGKSTLLKCLAGIYNVDRGDMTIHGRLAPFIELGVGFNPDLTARDNAIINAIMLGLTRKQALARFDEIVAFAELEEFMDLKLKNYSSGMQVRLAFSVAIQVDADILLIDEVLAVGDAAFQQKCYDQFTRLKEEGRTIIFVTHDMGAVEHFCDRAMLIERGKPVDIADPASIARQYHELNFRSVRKEAVEQGGPEVLRRAPVAEILGAWFETPSGETLHTVAQGDPLQIRTAFRFHEDVQDPIFSIALRNDLGHTVFATGTQLGHGPTGRFRAGQEIDVSVAFENWLARGRYRLTTAVSRDGTVADTFDLREDISSVVVVAAHSGGGAVDLPHHFSIEPRHAG